MSQQKVIRKGSKLFTKNLVPGRKVYGENLVDVDGVEYRQWATMRSKLAAAMAKGLKTFDFKEGTHVLYLGASSGTTTSHVSDIVDKQGAIFAVDFAPRVVRDLVNLSEIRQNIIPILEDASKIDELAKRVTMVDVVFQDIASKNQTQIFIDNVEMFLKQEGTAYFAVKARSIDVTERPQKIFNRVRELLKPKVKILEQIELDPFEKDHCMFVIKKKTD
jgi:fibrillarin-like pre-rRNA processing protein